MIHLVLVIAAILFVLSLLFHASGALVNLIWPADRSRPRPLHELIGGAPSGTLRC
jgi:hypothetical protein